MSRKKRKRPMEVFSREPLHDRKAARYFRLKLEPTGVAYICANLESSRAKIIGDFIRSNMEPVEVGELTEITDDEFEAETIIGPPFPGLTVVDWKAEAQ